MAGGQGLSRRAQFGAGLGRALDARFAHQDEDETGPGAPIAFTAWKGWIAELLRVVGPAAARSQRWARYETAYLHFFDFPELDVRDCALQLRFESIDDAIEALADPAGPIGAEERVRQALPRLLAGEHQPQDGGLLIQAAHAMLFARRP